MSFVTYDLIFLAVFLLGVVLFLSTRKKNLERQGIIYLYKTQLGIKFIDKFSKKFEKILKPLQYVVIASGYFLMIWMITLLIQTVHIYLTTNLANLVRAPPIAPLIPYFPKIFGLENMFPPLYFTYFIIALAIVAVVHEFSHGIFARINGLKIHSTGFAFLGPILGAFVEPDEKQMEKSSKFTQLSVLSAGTFANILMVILFGVILWLFFTGLFVPAGVKFNSYAMSKVDIADVSIIGESLINSEYTELETGRMLESDNPDIFAQLAPNEEILREKFYIKSSDLDIILENGLKEMYVYDDSPVFRNQVELNSAITEIDGKKINSIETLRDVIQGYKSGDKIVLKTVILEVGKGTVAESKEYEMELGEKDGRPSIGVAILQAPSKGFTGFVMGLYYNIIKDPSIHYESKLGDFGWFIHYLLWWIIVINFAVALFNMMPLGILDGGRFFYLSMWGLTGSERFGRKAYKVVTWFLIALFAILMIKWALVFFA